MKLSVVVPFYNELRTLPTVIDRLLAVDFGALGLETELVFVDDGSTDASRSLLDPAPRDDVRLLVHPRNLGKGAAVKTGLEAATGDVLCIQDADSTATASRAAPPACTTATGSPTGCST